jgi:hypothetical protein
MRDRTKVMIAIAGTALVVGGTTAIAGNRNGGGSSGTSSAPQGYGLAATGTPAAPRAFHGGGPRGGLHGDAFGAAATYLGLTREQLFTQLAAGKSLAQIAAATNGKSVAGLKDAIKAEANSDVDADVKAGRVTDAERDAFLASLDAKVDALVNQTGFAPHGPGGFGHGHHGGAFAGGEIAKYLGLTPAQLLTQLQSGKSLAEIATAQGKSVAGLKDAIVAAAKTHLDQEVAEGDLTTAQANQKLAELKSRLDDIVQNKGIGPREGFHGDWHGGPPDNNGTAGFRPPVRA